MKQVTLYNYHLESTDDLQLSVGDRVLTISFRWPVSYQEQYDLLVRRLNNMPAGDPLIHMDTITYDREYDWLEFYNSIPELGAGMEEWLETTTVLPQSLYKKDESVALHKLADNKELAYELSVYKEELESILCWYVTITDDLGDTRTGLVRPGGWINNQDNNWSLRFVADIDDVGRDDISKVTIEAETYEFV